jgi:hypothetical protein
VNRARKSVLIGGMLCMSGGIFDADAQSEVSALALIAVVQFGFQAWINNADFAQQFFFRTPP